MLHFVGLLFGLIATRFKSRARLEAEILILRHQLGILRRQAPNRLALAGLDRWLFVWIHRLFPSVVRSVTIIHPETIVRWHRAGFMRGSSEGREFLRRTQMKFDFVLVKPTNSNLWLSA